MGFTAYLASSMKNLESLCYPRLPRHKLGPEPGQNVGKDLLFQLPKNHQQAHQRNAYKTCK
jgi:hypothetical protein